MTNTDAATIPLLLEELWEVDFETWKDIRFLLLNSMMFSEPREIPLEQHIYHDIIQGCIQRVIAARGWMPIISLHWVGIERKIPVWYVDIRDHENFTIKSHQADTPAAAILAAYIEAKRARQ